MRHGDGFYGYLELLVNAISMTPTVNYTDLLCGVVCRQIFYFLRKVRLKF